MTTCISSMPSPRSLKRSFDEAELHLPNDHFISQPHVPVSGPCIAQESRPSTAEQKKVNDAILQVAANDQGKTEAANALTEPEKSAKKSKASTAERELKRIEKELKEKQKAEEKAKKEEERAQKEREREEERARKEREKEEERLRKEHEKEKKEEERQKKFEEKRLKEEEKKKAREDRDKAKEEDRAKREEEKQRKEDEKSKKDRSQLRLNAFFGGGAGPQRRSTESPSGDSLDQSSSRRGSLAGLQAESSTGLASKDNTPKKSQLSDYEQCFPSFFLKPHTTLAPRNRFFGDRLGTMNESIDAAVQHASETLCPTYHVRTIFAAKTARKGHARTPRTSVKEIIARIEGASNDPIDLTEAPALDPTPLGLLKDIPLKVLKFAEDVRPPYIGTFTRVTDMRTSLKLARNPCSRTMPDTNYDYDSEAEWEDPGEGEDLESDGEEEPDEEEDEKEMDGFLDDEEANDARAGKRRALLGALEPSCTGICWADKSDCSDLKSFRIDMTIEKPSFPIDPYSTTYWKSPSKPLLPSSTTPSLPSNQATLMEPPRIPLNPITHGPNALLHNNTQLSLVPPTATTGKSPKRLIPPDLLPHFKQAVSGSDLTKIGLVEQLKKKFPKQSKDAIKDTLEAVAERVGEKMADKKWVLRA